MDDDDDFDDLLAGVELLEDSSQESLTTAAANLLFYDDDDEGARRTSPPTSVGSRDAGASKADPVIQHAEGESVSSSANSCLAHSGSHATSSSTVIEKIEAVFEDIADALLRESNELAITMRTRTRPRAGVSSSTPVTGASSGTVKARRICFPGKTAEEAWRFSMAVVLRILELIHEAVRNGVVLSKRDMYYRDPALFGSQNSVNRYVDDIAFTFDVPRSMLNLTAVAKGLVAGAFNFCRRDGATVDASTDREGILVSSLREVLSVNIAAVEWILVIEKEATFRSIASSKFWDVASTRGVVVTGKGYPDIATRALLHFLSTPSPQNGFASPPVYGLVDCDPDGLAILSVYRNGSMALSHENADLCVPSLKWLGLRNEHMIIGGDDIHANQGLLTLTTRDRRKAIKMLERCVASEDGAELELRQALQSMLMFNTKAELQLLDAIPDAMTNLLLSELGQL